jgi:hypothetical protein
VKLCSGDQPCDGAMDCNLFITVGTLQIGYCQ